MKLPQTYFGYRHQAGFSIIESLIAAVVVGVGLLGAAKFQAELIQQSGTVKDRTQALSFANEKLEAIRTFTTPAEYTGLNNGSNTISISGGSVATFTQLWTVIENSAPLYKSVNVDVAWLGFSGNKNTSLTSFVGSNNSLLNGRTLYLQSNEVLPQDTFNAVVSGTVTQINGNGGWTISATPGQCSVNGNNYRCAIIDIPLLATQTMSLNFLPTNSACGNPTPVLTFDINNKTLVQNFAHAVNPGNCP